MIAADICQGDRVELAGLTHTVVQIIRFPANDVLRITLQCDDPALLEAGHVIQGHATVWWLRSAPIIASHSQHDRALRQASVDAADEAWQKHQDWLDKVTDRDDGPE